MNRMNLLITLAIPVLLCQNAQAQTSRLTGASNWLHDGAEFKLHDSTAYNYLSAARGGDLTKLLKYDEAINWSYVMGDTANNNTRSVQTFDGSNNLSTTITQNWDGFFTFAWVSQFKYVYFYNTSNQKTSMVTQHWDGTSAWITDSRNVYSYNAANQLYLDQYQLWDGVSTYNPSSQKTYYFDASGNLINESDVLFVAGTPNFTSDTDYTYNTGNKLLTKTGNTWSGSAWVNSVRWTNFYDSSTGNNTNRLYETYDGTSFVNDMQKVFSNFTSSHMAQTEIDQVWNSTGSGSWMDMYKYAYTYNSNNQLTSSTQQSNDISIGWTNNAGDMKSVYTYGSFVNAVANVSNAGGDAAIYPIPAQGTLNVDLNWNTAQAATVVICDVQGKVYDQWSTASATQNHHSINISNYADGIYFVKVIGAQGQIVKQIVVAH
jgi:hypothetical protein